MAESPSHKLGQIIGNVLEQAVVPALSRIAARYSLYLDQKGKRPCRSGVKVSLSDHFGNQHDLDFVLERGGSLTNRGEPSAFVEVAWRRYTKHSRNKAQEIQSAVGPLKDTFRHNAPCIAVVLAGEWTAGALQQLRSHGYRVLHFSYQAVIAAFAQESLDIIFDESTTDSILAQKVALCEANPQALAKVAANLLHANAALVAAWEAQLDQALSRRVRSVQVLRLFAQKAEYQNIEDAAAALQLLDATTAAMEAYGFEVNICFENGDQVRAQLNTLAAVHDFLAGFL